MSTGHILELGHNIALSSLAPGLDELTAGFGWTVTQPAGPQTELVPAVLLLNDAGTAVAPDALAFHNQLAIADGAVLVGEDTEQIDIALHSVPTHVAKLVFLVFVDPDIRKPGTFDTVTSAYIRLADRTGTELLRFTIPSQPAGVNTVKFGEMYRHNGGWKFRALGDGFAGGVAEIASRYSVALS
jgi:tellurium resistance protein TerD